MLFNVYENTKLHDGWPILFGEIFLILFTHNDDSMDVFKSREKWMSGASMCACLKWIKENWGRSWVTQKLSN